MNRKTIHIYGAAGSGTSSLAEAMARRFGYFHMDTDDYVWLPTDPLFTHKRPPEERITLMEKDILAHDRVVIAGSLCDWGDYLIRYFNFAVRVETDVDLRIKRLEERQRRRFGSRIDPDGDMHDLHLGFIAWARAYDTGDISIRSIKRHDEWQKLLVCDRITVDGSKPVDVNLALINKHFPL